MDFMFQHDLDFYQSEITRRFDDRNFVSSEFLELLTQLHQQPALYEADRFEQFELAEVFSYLKASHRYYLDTWLPKINQTVFQLQAAFGKDFMAVQLMTLFLDRYQQDLEQHIGMEEQVLFAFVSEMLQGGYDTGRKDFVLNHFLFTHNDNVIVHLRELHQDLIRLEAGLSGNLLFEVLFNQLEIFQNDLMIHGLIEDEVFIPKVLNYIDTHFEKLNRINSGPAVI